MEKCLDLQMPDTGHEFEILSQKVCQIVFNVPFQFYGHNGQKQSGIDLYSKNFEICVQCKNYQGKSAVKQLLAELEKDYYSAVEKFQSRMKKYVLTTTVSRDKNIQDKVESLTENYEIEIQVIFWEDFKNILREHPQIISQYNSVIGLPSGLISDKNNDPITNIDARLAHADKLLGYGKFNDALAQYNLILASNIRCGDAFLGKVMAKAKVRNREEFKSYFCENIVYDSIDYRFAEEYANHA